MSTPSGGANTKFTLATPGLSPIPRLSVPTTSLNASFVAPAYSHPKLPVFSGHENKGEVTYEVWSFEVKCLQNPHAVPDHVLLQTIRTSLRGSAKTMITNLGEDATVTDILTKLDDFYGNVSTCETLMQTFYSDFQKDDDSIVKYGSRLEQTLTRALQTTSMELSLKDAMLHPKFWTGLSNQQLKNSTRHLFDKVKDFQLLLREMRKVEQEQVSISLPAGKQKVAQQHSGHTADLPDVSQLSKQLNEIMEKMKNVEKTIDFLFRMMTLTSCMIDSMEVAVITEAGIEAHTEVPVEAEVIGNVIRILITMIKTTVVIEVVVPGIETVAVPTAEVPTAMNILEGI